MRLRQPASLSSPREPKDPKQRTLVNRQRLREFLRAVPRTEPDARLQLLGQEYGMPPRFVSREALTEAIEQMRPRIHQIIRLCLEERNTQAQVCAYLNDISTRTLERDQGRGLDFLIALAQEAEN